MICLNKECAKDFTPKTHNQKYCSDDCCRVATNKRIMEKYYEKKAIKNGAHRPCSRCGASLNRYNPDSLCSMCDRDIYLQNRKRLMDIINDIG